MNQFEVTPLFSSVICAFFLEESADNFYSTLIEETIFNKTYYGSGSEVSEDFNVLEKYPDLKKEIVNKFLEFKNNVLRLESTDFKMTTSWITKTPPNSYSQRHSHKNSYYSGILYLTDHSDQSPIMFFNPNENFNSILTNSPVEYNVLNSTTWTVHPEKNKVLFFPSYLDHMIMKNLSSDSRYSIAFNFFPTGEIGNNDSYIML